MPHPLVVHCKKSKFDVYIGRPSKWGNPYMIWESVATRKQVIDQYEQMIRSNPKIVAEIKAELKGKILGCWCAPNDCHGDVLARIANEEG